MSYQTIFTESAQNYHKKGIKDKHLKQKQSGRKTKKVKIDDDWWKRPMAEHKKKMLMMKTKPN